MLPVVGTAYYNGFHFPPAMTSSITTTPVYDSTSRTVKYMSHTITIEFIVYPGVDDRPHLTHPVSGADYFPIFPDSLPTADDGYSQLRRLLTEAGGVLKFTDQGFGNDVIVSGGSNTALQDVDNGPKPLVLNWEPIAASKAIRVVWQCTFSLAECGTSTNIYKQVSEFSYDVTWGIAADGSTTRSVNGILEIAVQQIGRVPQNSADQWRERLLFPLPDRFRRESQSFNLSADRRTLRFSISDQEMISDNPFHAGIVQCDVTERVSSATAKNFFGGGWNISIDGTITVALGYSRWFAWMAFLNIVKARRAAARQHARVRKGNESTATIKSDYMFTTHMEIQEEIFGRSMSFSIGWDIKCDYTAIFPAAGIWDPIPNQDWTTWQNSLSGSGQHVRGTARLKELQAGNKIVGFCTSFPVWSGSEQNSTITPGKGPQSVFESDCPSPEDSWDYDPKWKLVEDTSRSTHYVLGGSDSYGPTDFSPKSTGNGIAVTSSGNIKRPIIQRRGNVYWKLIFYGTAFRVGFPVPEPNLTEFGGVTVHPTGRRTFDMKTRKYIDKCKVYHAKFYQEYQLDEKPTGELYKMTPDPSEWKE